MTALQAPQSFDVVIIGGGAAGLFAAIHAGQRGKRVVVLEKADKLGAKILISGGGRCNFTNLHAAPENYLSSNPHFVKSALRQYTQQDFITLVRKHGIAFHEKKLGQLFCDGSARQIVRMLEREAVDAGVQLRTGVQVQDITRAQDFLVRTQSGDFTTPVLMIATGGPSIPKIGASGFAYKIAAQFGVPVVSPRPALVPLVARETDLEFYASLAGVAVHAVARIGKHHFRENILFTHRGLSGPAILQSSSYWQDGKPIVLDLAPQINLAEILLGHKMNKPKILPATALAENLPQRLAVALCAREAWHTPLGQCTDAQLRGIAARLQHFDFLPAGSEGYAKAEVTAGGIDTQALSSKTMECRTVPGLYFIGEAVDVTGWLGGYNFQWAWSSGWCAGTHC